MAQYAQTTDVTPEKSRQEVEAILKRYGATAFGYIRDDEKGVEIVTFRLHGRVIRLSPPKVNLDDKKFQYAANGRILNTSERNSRVKQAPQQAWRALVLYVKALCEAIENNVVSVDQAFMHGVVLPNGITMGEWAGEQVQGMIEAGRMPPLLPGG